MKPWKDLSMKERGAFIRVGIKNGITSVDGIRDAYNKFACGGHKFGGTSEPTQRLYQNSQGNLLSQDQYDELVWRAKNNADIAAVNDYKAVQIPIRQQQPVNDRMFEGNLNEITVRPDIAYNSDVRNIPAIETTEEPISDEIRKRFANSVGQQRRQAQMTPAEQWANYYEALANLSYEDRLALENDRKFKRFIGGVAGGVTALPALMPLIGYTGAGIVNNMAAFNPATYVDFIASKLGASTAYSGFGATTIPGMATNAFLGAEMGYEGYKDLRYNKNKKWYDYPLDVLGIAGGIATGAELGIKSAPEILNTSIKGYNTIKNGLVHIGSNGLLGSGNPVATNQFITQNDIKRAIEGSSGIMEKIFRRNIDLRYKALQEAGFDVSKFPTKEQVLEDLMKIMKDYSAVSDAGPSSNYKLEINRTGKGGSYYNHKNKQAVLDVPSDRKWILGMFKKKYNVTEDTPQIMLHESEHTLQYLINDYINSVYPPDNIQINSKFGMEHAMFPLNRYTNKERNLLGTAYIRNRFHNGHSLLSTPKAPIEQGATNAQLVMYLEDLGYDLSSIKSIDELPDIVEFAKPDISKAKHAAAMKYDYYVKHGIADKIKNGYVHFYDGSIENDIYDYFTKVLADYQKAHPENIGTKAEKVHLYTEMEKHIKEINDDIKKAILYVGVTTGGAYMLNQASGNQNNNQY